MKAQQDITRRARLLMTLSVSALMAAPGATSALAQETGVNTTVDDSVIIVTAQRRSEALEDVPMSVTVINQDTMAATGVTSLRDLSNVASGLQIAAGGAFPQPSLRGVTTLLNGTFENNVAVYVDGVYQPVAQAINIDLPNIEGVQVLKGPQGTLYGRNATGGAILLTTINPGDTWQGKAEATYARFDDKRFAGYIAGPISDVVGISIAGYLRDGDGYNRLLSRTSPGDTECCATPIRQEALRLKARAELGNVKATLAFNYIKVEDSRSNLYMPVENVNPGGTFAYGARPGAGSLRAFLQTSGNHQGVQAYDIGNIMNLRQYEGAGTLEIDTGIGTLQSITSYSEVTTRNAFDFDGTYIPANYVQSLQREKTWQQSINYNIDAIDNLNLTFGGSYFHDTLVFVEPNQQYIGNFADTGTGTIPGTLADYTLLSESFFDQKKEAWAIYGDATYHVTLRISINIGGRYSEERQHISAEIIGPAAFAPFGLFRDPQDVSAKFSKFTPKASIRYEISPRTNVYASYSQGFRSGAYNSQAPACVNASAPVHCTYDPAKQETINAYEIGFKTASRKFRFDAAAFYYDYKDLQIGLTTAFQGFPVVINTNAPKATIYGAEASFDWTPIENLTLRGSGTWLHARYGKGFIFSGTGIACASPTAGGALNTNADFLKTCLNVSQTQDLSDLMMSRAPNFTGNIGVDYLVPMGDGGLRFAANVKYTTKYVATNPSIWGTGASVPADRQREQRFVEGPYALLNASVQWTDPTDHYYVRVWGTNITNHKYRLHYSGTATGTYMPMAEPAIYGVTLGYKL